MKRILAVLFALGLLVPGSHTGGADEEPKRVQPFNMTTLNSPRDEDDPHMISSGMGLFFCVTEDGLTRLMVSERQRPRTPWGPPQLWPQFKGSADNRSVFMTRDGVFPQHLLYATNKDFGTGGVDNFDIFYLIRQGPDADYTTLSAIQSVDTPADELHPWMTPDGKHLYFSRKEKDGPWQVFVASRQQVPGPFNKPVRVELPDGFHHATLTPNGLTMYLQGPLEDGRQGLFRSQRVNGSWSKPEPLTMLNHPEAPRGDITPNLSRDGVYLLFASDRPGGKGGMDLYYVPTSQLVRKP